ncbi:hypothetical protein E4U58_007395 [Claviceps cyperi]|nr:hypothetical protein E4U58_007395 [Claviceps cyperi]
MIKNQCSISRMLLHAEPIESGPSQTNIYHVTDGKISPDAGHNAPHQPQVGQIERRHDGNQSLPLTENQLGPSPAELPTTGPFEEAGIEYWSAIPGVEINEHRAKATKKAQEKRNSNAQASRRYRAKRSAGEIAAEAIKKTKKDEARARSRERNITSKRRKNTSNRGGERKVEARERRIETKEVARTSRVRIRIQLRLVTTVFFGIIWERGYLKALVTLPQTVTHERLGKAHGKDAQTYGPAAISPARLLSRYRLDAWAL